MDIRKIQKYAEILIKIGINIQKGQILVIRAPIECAEFTRMAAKYAYEAGAKEVVIQWGDELSTKMKYLYASDEVFDEFPSYLKEFYLSLVRKGAAFFGAFCRGWRESVSS